MHRVAWLFCLGLLFGSFGWFGCEGGECRFDGDCSNTSICRKGICTVNLVGQLCKKEEDCKVGEQCINQKCVRPQCQQGAQEACYDGPSGTSGKGLCQSGIKTCQGGKWSACLGQILPTSEVCDKLDNDCNDKIDDSPSCSTTCKNAETRPCFTGPPSARNKGVCRAGTETCAGGKWGACLGQTLPQSKEVCGDKLDNNCNDQTDEGCGPCKPGETRPCYSGLSNTRGVGVCKDGKQTCLSSDWGPCQGEVKPSLETCNNKDDDCNNKTDDSPSCQGGCKNGETRECYTGPAGTKNVGECRAGKETCQNAKWSSCLGEIKPVGEKCSDMKDNNCNKQVDEGCGVCTNGVQEVCYSGQQGCSKNPDGSYSCNTPCRSGIRTCQGGQWTNCTGQTIPLPRETCGNHVDDDCNGQVDDGCGVCTNGQTQPCYTGAAGTQNVGECRAGVKNCVGNNWGACIGQVKPTNEVCGDSKDNNCNKQVDENCSTKLHQNCANTTECDAGQICLLAGTQGICFQDCTTSSSACLRNADGRKSCEAVAKTAQGQNISICVKKAQVGAACNTVQSVFCTAGHSCIAGVCKKVTWVAVGGVCDSKVTPPKLCGGGSTCVLLITGRKAICLGACDPNKAGSCSSGFNCAKLQNGGGVCIQACTSTAQCSFQNHECSTTNKMCVPKS